MNFIEYIKTHIVYFIVSIAIIIISGFFLLLLPIQNPTQVESQEILLWGISLDNWGIWITIIGAVIASIWAMYEYTKATSIRQQEKAYEIAKIFSNGLLKKCSIVIAVYENSPLNPLINNEKVKNYTFQDFTTEELRELTNDDDFPSKYKKINNSIDFDYLYYRVLESRITTYSEYKKKYESIDKEKQNKHSYTSNDAKALFVFDNSSFPFHFCTLVDDVLNTLEYVCTSLSTHAAGSKYIYQSLHQIFFDTVETLVIEISSRNNGKYADKFYTNIIHVYKDWQKTYRKSLKKELKRKYAKKKILNPKIKTVE
ncbi:MAG: hypothetical protein HFJ35_02065 [Clostridia bacterium]|nr:hypothetical protein [Clostridia bacterium]